MKALPTENKELDHLPKQYVANIVYTIVGTDFKDWVQDRIDARNEKVKKEKDLLVELDPEILAIFNASTSVSGKSQQSAKALITSFLLLQSARASARTCSKCPRRGAGPKLR